MTPSEYQKLAARTLLPEPGFDIPGDQLMLVWCAIGLAGEAGEVAESLWKTVQTCRERQSAVRKECGDYLWYLAGICTVAQIQFADICKAGMPIDDQDTETPIELLWVATSRVAEIVKKGVFHRHAPDNATLRESLGTCFYHLQDVMEGYGTIFTVMDENIAKLRERYPNGFTREDSQRRVDVTPEDHHDAQEN